MPRRSFPVVHRQGQSLRLPDPQVRWRASQAREVLEGHRASGLSLAAFARRHGMGSRRLGWWRKRLGLEKARPRGGGRAFVPLVVRAGAEAWSEPRHVEIMLAGGARLRVLEGCDASWVATLIAALGSAGC